MSFCKIIGKKIYTSFNKALNPFDLIHFDILGPIVAQSVHDHLYFLTTLDDYSIFTWLALMKHKHEVSQHVIG